MPLRLCVLGSGSKGNAVYVASETTALLVDAGLSARAVRERLGAVGANAGELAGICLTHEHNDHTAGIKVLQRRDGVSLYTNRGTADALLRAEKNRDLKLNIFDTGSAFEIGDLRVQPFSVPHDAYDPVGFVIEGSGDRIAVATDMGMATGVIRERLRGCRALVVEANHDERMLQEAPRPWVLRQRIMGRQGHLSNRAAAALLVDIAGPELEQVFLAHLSEDCNQPHLAQKTVIDALRAAGQEHIRVSLTYADRVSEAWPTATGT